MCGIDQRLCVLMTPATGLLDHCVVYGVKPTDSATPELAGELRRVRCNGNVTWQESGGDISPSAALQLFFNTHRCGGGA